MATISADKSEEPKSIPLKVVKIEVEIHDDLSGGYLPKTQPMEIKIRRMRESNIRIIYWLL